MSSCLGKFYNSGWKYTLMVTWVAISAYVFSHTFFKFRFSPEFTYTYNILGVTLCTARGAAAVLNLNVAAVVLPMCHTLDHRIRCFFRKYIPVRLTTWDKRSFHIFIGYIILGFSGIHVTSHVINSYNFYAHYNLDYRLVNPFPRERLTPYCVMTKTLAGVTGLMLLLLVIALVVTSISPIRRRFFNLFWYTHRVYPVVFLLILIHGIRGPIRRQTNVADHVPGCRMHPSQNNSLLAVQCADIPRFEHVGAETYIWLSVPLVVFIFDLLIRVTRRSDTVQVTSAKSIATDILELQIRTTRKRIYPGQVVFLNCGSISTIEWHPFSVVQVPTPNNHWTLIVWIKICGDWTRDLQRALCTPDQAVSDIEENKDKRQGILKMDGPYNSKLDRFQQFQVVVCVAGGIGVTPFLSYIQYLAENRKKPEQKEMLQNMYLIYVTREETHLHACLNHISNHVDMVNGTNENILDISLFYTGKDRTLQADERLLNNVSFQRPDLKNVFGTLHKKHKRKTIGVFTCGPEPLCQNVKQCCLRETTVYTKFNFHKENF